MSIGKQPPDIILLDVLMPGMDGFEFCQRLKAQEQTRDIPVIFITSLEETEHKIKAFQLGGVDYITKPFIKEEVLARTQVHLRNRRLQQQLQQENARFQTLANASFEGLVIHDRRRILDVNQPLCQLSGYSRSELLGRNPLTLIPTALRRPVWKYLANQEIVPREIEALGRDGASLALEIQCRPLEWHGHHVMLTAVRDIAWRKQLEREQAELRKTQQVLRASLRERYKFGDMVGKSQAMQEVYEFLTRAAASDQNVIIYGETGVGKELAARTIHQLSDRREQPFVAVNCSAIPENLGEQHFFGSRKGAFTDAVSDRPGYFESARAGVLFLDEVGELPLTMQAKLLRVLQNGEYTPVGDTRSRTADVRIIAATNRELRIQLQQGNIREDFFHRIHVLAVNLPPLRQRRDDIPLLLEHFWLHLRPDDDDEFHLPPEILERLQTYDWPGNVRELHNVLARYLTTGVLELDGQLTPAAAERDLPFACDGLSLSQAMETFEAFYIQRALRQNAGQKLKTAETLEVDRKTLYKKLKKYENE